MFCLGTLFISAWAYEHPTRLPYRREIRLEVAIHQLVVVSQPCPENERVRLEEGLPRRYRWL